MPATVAMLPESRRRIDFASADGLDDLEGAVASARNRNELLVALTAIAEGDDQISAERLTAADAALTLLDWIASSGEPESAMGKLDPTGLRAAAAAVIRPGSLRVAVAGSALSFLVADRRRGLHRVATGPPIAGDAGFRHRSITSAFGRGATAVLMTGDVDVAATGSCRPSGLHTCSDLLRALQHHLPAAGAVAVVRRR